jgi:hypothetical protein
MADRPIYAESADGMLHEFPSGTDPGVIDSAMKQYAASVAPKVEAAPTPEPAAPPAGTLKAMGKAAGQETIQSAGETVSGVGAVTKMVGGSERRETGIDFDLMNRLDQGEDFAKLMKEAPGNLARLALREYQIATPEQRQQIRQSAMNTMAAPPGQVETTGEHMMKAGEALSEKGKQIFPLTPEEEQRPTVIATKMVAGLTKYIGAAVAGGMPAVIGVAGVDAFGKTYNDARTAGRTDDEAMGDALISGMVNGGLMAVPIGQATKIFDAIPVALKGDFIKALAEAGKSGLTLTAFSQVQQVADNVIAKNTYDPTRKPLEGVGEHLPETFVAGAVLPLAAHGISRLARTPEQTAKPVLDAPTVDDAIARAREVVDQPAIEETAAQAREYGNEGDQDQASILKLFGGLNQGTVERAQDGTYHYNDGERDFPLRPWDGAQRPDTIPTDLADAQRDHYGRMGVRVIYLENDRAIPFDGAVDPAQPDTIFLSNNPDRNAAQVGAHELTHVLESTRLPDGTNLGDLLQQQVAAGITPEGRAYAERLFGQTAPERRAFPEGPEGDSLHADAVTGHLIRELGADIGSEAPKFQTFLPRVVDAVQQRYGSTVAGEVVRKLVEGIQQAMRTLRQFFFHPAEGAEYGQPPTVSQHWVTNLEAIHDTLAKMYAERFAPPETERPAEVAEPAAAMPSNEGEKINAAPEAPGLVAPESKPVNDVVPPEGEKLVTPQRIGPEPGPGYEDARTRAETMTRWLADLDAKRREAAAASPQATLLRQTEAAILGKVKGIEARLTVAAKARLETVRQQLHDLLNPEGDSPDMARVRESLVAEHQRMADAAAARPREEAVPAEAPAAVEPKPVEPSKKPVPAPVEAAPERPPGEVIPLPARAEPAPPPQRAPMLMAAESPRLSPREPGLRPRAWVEFGRSVARALRGEVQPNTMLTLGRTPEALRLVGAPDRPMAMRASVANKAAFEKHDVPLSALERLPDQIERPVAILASATEPNALVVMLDATNANGHPLVAAVHLAEGRIQINRVASVYPKERDLWFREQVRAGRLRYLDTEKSRGLAADLVSEDNTSGVQFPGGASLRGTASPGSDRKIFTQADLVKGAEGPKFSPREEVSDETRGRTEVASRAEAGPADGGRARGADTEGERSRRLREKGLLAPEAEEGGVKPDAGDKGPAFSPRQEEPPAPFYSSLTRAVEGLRLAKATPGQWEATIRNMPGVKAEERAWAGLDEWLRKQTRSVTKAEVLDYLREHEVKVTEKVGGEQPIPMLRDVIREELTVTPTEHQFEVTAGDGRKVAIGKGTVKSEEAARDYAVRYLNEKAAEINARRRNATTPTDTKFASYTLPGGKNYRELLLTLPRKQFEASDLPAGWRVEQISRDSFRVVDGADADTPLGYGDTREDAVTQALAENKAHPDATEEYRGSHWDEANVLAHVRFDERTGSNGEKVLHVAEIQSDWHQAGKKRGYLPDSPHTGVPDAPFKTSWPEMAMKRMLRYAAEHGYDRLSWDTGDTNAARYDLSKQVRELSYNGDNRLIATGHGRETLINKIVSPEELPDVIGKEAADKLLAQKPHRYSGDIDDNTRHLTGTDLKVGGEGMKAFYDRQLPLIANKIGKRFGAKVEDTTINAGPDEAAAREAMRSGDSEAIGEATGDRKIAAHSIEITPAMREGVMQGQPLFSPRITSENTTRQYTPEEKQLFERVGRAKDSPTLRDKIDGARDDIGRKVIRETLDAYIGIKGNDPEGYLAARMANSVGGAQEVFRLYGTLKFNGATYDYKDLNGGVRGLVKALGPEAGDFMWWVAAHRAERLKAEDRENLFSAEDIATGKQLNRGEVEADYQMPNGTVTRRREAVYADALRRLDAFNKNALDLGVESGLLKRDDVDALWSNPFYVPFYREAEASGSKAFVGGRASSAFVRQNAFKTLKGGTEKLNNDLWENALGNWDHMIDAALRNKAASQILETASRPALGAAEKVTTQDFNHRMTKAEKAETVWAMEDGEKQYYRVTDPMVFKAVSALEAASTPGPIMNVARWFSRALRYGVTANPLFAVRNLIRDTENTIAVSQVSANPFKNLADGFGQIDVGDRLKNLARAMAGQEAGSHGLEPEAVSAMAGGALMRMGSASDAGITKTAILDSPGKLQAFGRYIAEVAGAYKETLASGEDVNRLALYKQLREQGAPHDFAAFSARDLQDFTLRGASPFVRTITDITPFLGARLQGLYKLGRAASDADKSVTAAVASKVARSVAIRAATVMGAMTLAGLALDAIYHDDEDYKKRTEYDRQTYYWFKIGDAQFRVPKGFELAALSSLAADGVEAFFDKEMTGQRWVNNFWTALSTNLQVQAPAAIQPVIDLATNTRSTGGPIESTSMQRLEPQERYTADSTLIARGMSAALNAAMRVVAPRVDGPSPVQIDYLANAYGSWLATSVMGMADTVARSLSSEPERPAGDFWAKATQGLVRTDTAPQSRYVDMLYEQGKQIEEAHATFLNLAKLGRGEEARAFAQDREEELSKYPAFERVKRLEGQINQQIRVITDDAKLSGEQKRVKIMQLNAMKNRAAEGLFTTGASP